ncbi:GNAT family N-acetyltransferase [Streptomyces sp. NPDC057557]|uniref:GNAT family N-acetyltransferase n=1 Tax=Streptomyces sp. NPDC057557 TaxID=3346167 RepID=UPI00369C8706
MLSATRGTASSNYVTSIADTEEQIRAAQRLRYRVFADEMGAPLDTPLSGHDVDASDDVADHLIVTDTTTGEVVGTYRLLSLDRAEVSHSAAEFNLRGLYAARSSVIEVGRCCIHPDYRSGAVIKMMWAGMARYVLLSGRRYLAGCASVPLDDGGRAASHAWRLGAANHAAPAGYRVRPHRPWTPQGLGEGKPDYAVLPPLLRGHLHLGAWMCGAPAHDPECDVADFFVLLDMDRMSDRHRRYFLGETQ